MKPPRLHLVTNLWLANRAETRRADEAGAKRLCPWLVFGLLISFAVLVLAILSP